MTKLKTKLDPNMQSFEIEGIIDYARVHEPSTANSKIGQYSLSLRLTTPEELQAFKAKMKEHNLSETVFNISTESRQPRIKDNGDGTFSVAIKRDAVNSRGEKTTIDVVDAAGNAIPKNILIGNGSRAVVSGFTYQSEKVGGVLRLTGIQVLDLVPYKQTRFKPRPGYTVGSTSLDHDGTDTTEDLTSTASPF